MISLVRQIRWIILAFGVLVVSGCESIKGGGKKKKEDSKGFYTIPSPQGSGWKRVGEGDGVSFIKVNDKADDDVVTLFVATENTEKPLETAEEIVAHLRSRGSASMQEVVADEFAGLPGARFMAYQEDAGQGGSEEERESLGLPVREAGMRFYVRTKGFVFSDPKKPTRLIKIGISRTSFHGFIGSHFESIGDAFMMRFFTENKIADSAMSGVGGFVDPAGMLDSDGGGGGGGESPGNERPPDFDLN